MGHFTSKLFAFLRDLSENNDRDWFRAHQDDYERHVREPALSFINDMAGPLAEISPHFVADSRKVGGSLFRIQRDVRFSADKSPYKTNTGVHFRHYLAKDVHAPGFYLHLEPGACFMGAGIWRPDASTAHSIRQSIVERPEAWTAAVGSERFTELFSLDGEVLKRPPRGFDPAHPLVEDLKRKDFIASTRLTHGQVTSDRFGEELIDLCRRTTPFTRFLCEAVGVPF